MNSYQGSCILNFRLPDSNLKHPTLSSDLFPQNFVFLNQNEKKIGATTFLDHRKHYAFISQSIAHKISHIILHSKDAEQSIKKIMNKILDILHAITHIFA